MVANHVLCQLSYTPESQKLVGLGRFELPTSPLSGVRSNQLSYRPAGLCRKINATSCFGLVAFVVMRRIACNLMLRDSKIQSYGRSFKTEQGSDSGLMAVGEGQIMRTVWHN